MLKTYTIKIEEVDIHSESDLDDLLEYLSKLNFLSISIDHIRFFDNHFLTYHFNNKSINDLHILKKFGELLFSKKDLVIELTRNFNSRCRYRNQITENKTIILDSILNDLELAHRDKNNLLNSSRLENINYICRLSKNNVFHVKRNDMTINCNSDNIYFLCPLIAGSIHTSLYKYGPLLFKLMIKRSPKILNYILDDIKYRNMVNL